MSVADLLAPYQSGSCEPWTVDVMIALIRGLRPTTLIETGTFEGLTTKALAAHLAPGAHLYTIECDEERAAIAREFLADCPNVSVACRDAISAMAEFDDNTVDFIFLDDDHDPNHVVLEFLEVRRILKPGGVCCVHDVLGPYDLEKVMKLVGGICLPLLPLHVAGGLGVFVK